MVGQDGDDGSYLDYPATLDPPHLQRQFDLDYGSRLGDICNPNAHQQVGRGEYRPGTRFPKYPQQPLTLPSSPPSSPPTSSPPPAPLSSPSPEYITLSQELSSTLSTPGTMRKLLILDLNGTLIYRTPHVRGTYSRRIYQRPLRVAHARPYLPTLVAYLFHPQTKTWLDTMVWSSAQPHSVADMVERGFGERRAELVAVWARDTLGLKSWEYHGKTQTTKDLAKPWAVLRPDDLHDDQERDSEGTTGLHSAKTTLLIDDSPRKARLQPWNHLCLPEYDAALRRADVAVAVAEATWKREAVERESDFDTSSSRSTTSSVSEHGVETSVAENGTKRKRKRERKKKKRTKVQVGERENLFYSIDLSGEDSVEGEIKPLLAYDPTLLAVVGVLDAVKSESNVAGWVRAGGVLCPKMGEVEKESGHCSVTDGEAIQQRQWYEDAELVRYWARRGVRALNDLGVEVVSGIVAT